MFLTWAEMRRRAGRFVLLGGAVALLVVLLLFFQAVAGTLTSELTGALERQDGEVVVYAEDARRSPLASVLEPDVAQSIAAVDGVHRAAGVRWVPFTVDGQEGVLLGVDPQGPGLPGPVSDGRLPAQRGETAVAASAFGADSPELGSTITIDGVPDELTVVGVVDGAVVNALATYVVTTETAQAAVEARAGAPVPPNASFVAVDIADDATAAQVAERVTATVDGVEALPRATAVASLPGIETIDRSFSILYVLLYLVVAIVTAVFFLILTVQKRESLLLLRAIGAGRRDVVIPTLIQLTVVVAGSTVLGAGVAAGLLRLGQDTFGASIEPSTVAVTAGAMLVLGLLAGSLSVRRILAIEPVQAVKTGGLE